MCKKFLSTLAIAASCLLGSSFVQAAPAVVVNPAGGCGLFDGNGDYIYFEQRPQAVTRSVWTQSENGITMWQCNVRLAPSSSGQAVHFDAKSTGAGCFIVSPLPNFFITTNDWKETVSANGDATLTCRSQYQ